MESLISQPVIDLVRNYVDALAQDAKKNAPVASGKLRNSYQSNVSASVSSLIGTVEAEDYHKYVEDGRKPNSKRPPIEAIKRWAGIKGIPLSAAYPIARAIGQRGIVAKPYIPNFVGSTQESLVNSLDNEFAKNIDTQVTLTITTKLGAKEK